MDIVSRNDIKVDCRYASEKIRDWYDVKDSPYYVKNIRTLKVNKFVV
jgi:hypothetical protein